MILMDALTGDVTIRSKRFVLLYGTGSFASRRIVYRPWLARLLKARILWNRLMLRTFLGLKFEKLRTSQGFKNFRRSFKKRVAIHKTCVLAKRVSNNSFANTVFTDPVYPVSHLDKKTVKKLSFCGIASQSKDLGISPLGNFQRSNWVILLFFQEGKGSIKRRKVRIVLGSSESRTSRAGKRSPLSDIRCRNFLPTR